MSQQELLGLVLDKYFDVTDNKKDRITNYQMSYFLNRQTDRAINSYLNRTYRIRGIGIIKRSSTFTNVRIKEEYKHLFGDLFYNTPQN